MADHKLILDEVKKVLSEFLMEDALEVVEAVEAGILADNEVADAGVQDPDYKLSELGQKLALEDAMRQAGFYE